ncbi:glycoside hydrolase family 172 protein [Niabella aurantiaca]|uniref:glycoside hydrolase family 172 protein n=1 Tax=Niabella aurantiaca TaxID=379900 RepID=UPI00036C55D7|nr:glycoside hydrolase family 172 protein [Niabella aurantiaca]
MGRHYEDFGTIGKVLFTAVLLWLLCGSGPVRAQPLYELPAAGTETRWISFENIRGEKGAAAKENKGAKGHSSEWIRAGERKLLMDYSGAGVIHRIWMTVIDRSPAALRSIRIEMYWDHAAKPAVSAPLGDFFGISLGLRTAFQSAAFADPEGRSFNCYIPMPFKKHAKIVFINESKSDQLLFYDINFSVLKRPPQQAGYFHAYWSTNKVSALGTDFAILPEIKGKGRFLGTNIGIVTDKVYRSTWFGEGEVKIYLDGDQQYPTLAGTGTEDYIGSAWNLGPFSNLYQGAPIVDKAKGRFSFYRYHIPDPVFFSTSCKVTIQQMGGGGRDSIRAIIKAGGQARPVSVMTQQGLIPLLDSTGYPDLFDDRFSKDEWVNFYRVDNYSATAYFYLDRPGNDLPPIAGLDERLKGL